MLGGATPRSRVLWIAAAAACAAVVFGAGFALRSALSDSASVGPIVASTTPREGSATASPSTTPTTFPPAATDTAVSTEAPVGLPSPVTELRTPLPTPDASIQPFVSAISLDPSLGAHIEQASVDIAIAVDYQAGSVSNVLSWYIRYCASPIDCNTFGYSAGATDIVPGSSGRITLGGVFPAGGNYLRPIVICQYTVEIGHFVTPEARWQSDVASDPRCHPEVTGPKVEILDVTPPLGTSLRAGNTIAVNIRYDAVSADTLSVRYAVEGCAPLPAKNTTVTGGSSSVTTVLIPVSTTGAGTLKLVEATLLVGGRALTSYDFGDCPTSPPR